MRKSSLITVSHEADDDTYHAITIRIPIELARIIGDKANTETRTLSGQIIHMLKQAVYASSMTSHKRAEK